MAGMTDANGSGNNLVPFLLQLVFGISVTSTIGYTAGGTGGPSAKTVTLPFKLRFTTATGSATANGTEATAGNNPGYTAGGISMGAAAAFTGFSSRILANANSVSYTASGTQTANLTGAEVWDSSGTALRFLQGALSAAVTGVVSGDTVQVAASGISADATGW